MQQKLLRQLPKVDEIMADEKVAFLTKEFPSSAVLEAVRTVIDGRRQGILSGAIKDPEGMDLKGIIEDTASETLRIAAGSLRPVINATGVVLHTNLGRACLPERAMKKLMSVAGRYSTLEYDPEKGERGSRYVHAEELLKKITGAEAAIAVNNNAAATMLAMAALGQGKEMIVSRGELVEIGGSFRIPDIMAQSGVKLAEVGTTNKTRLSDYESRITEDTAALLKVHTSNYRIIGFSEDTSVRELRDLGDKYGLPVIYDMGSGLIMDLSPWGIREPVVKDALEEGADLVLFSGDKLMGGPQAGIICGRKDLIGRIKKHPLARVVRADKMTFAALEATLQEYMDMKAAAENIPVLSMITRPYDELLASAMRLKQMTDGITDPGTGKAAYITGVTDDESKIGGGSAPETSIKSAVMWITREGISPDSLEKLLREGETPIIARIKNDKVVFDPRTLMKGDMEIITDRLESIALKTEK